MSKTPLRRTSSVLVASLVMVASVLSSWAWAGDDPNLDAKVVARQRRMPDDRNRATAYVTDRAEMRRQWERFNMRGDVPHVPFRRRVALFAALGGSSSCPPHFGSVRLNREERRLTVRIRESEPADGACTDDFVPRTFVITVRREDLPPGELRVRIRRV